MANRKFPDSPFMENKTNFIQNKDLILFMEGETPNQTNFLKTVIQFLKLQKSSPYLRFSYSGPKHDLSRVLSLKENILFEVLCSKGEKDKDFDIWQYVSELNNPFLLKLFRVLPLEDGPIKNINDEVLKIASIIKTFLKDSPLFIFENIEDELSEDKLDIVLKAIEHHCRANNKMVILKSSKIDLWHHLANKILFKNPIGEFVLSPVPSLQLLNSFKIDEYYESEKEKENSKMSNSLVFSNIPNSTLTK